MIPTREQLLAAAMPGSESDLARIQISIVRKVPVPTSGAFNASLIAPEDPSSEALATTSRKRERRAALNEPPSRL